MNLWSVYEIDYGNLNKEKRATVDVERNKYDRLEEALDQLKFEHKLYKQYEARGRREMRYNLRQDRKDHKSKLSWREGFELQSELRRSHRIMRKTRREDIKWARRELGTQKAVVLTMVSGNPVSATK